jgi:hypothetical protein
MRPPATLPQCGGPTVADRVAQTVVAARLEREVEPIFHSDSYGYRPGRSALDAVGACRTQGWKYDWAIDSDIQKFFDSVPWDLIVKAVEAHTDQPWMLLYIERRRPSSDPGLGPGCSDRSRPAVVEDRDVMQGCIRVAAWTSAASAARAVPHVPSPGPT